MDPPCWKSARGEKRKAEGDENGAGERQKSRPQIRGNGGFQNASQVHAAPELPMGPLLSTINRTDLSEHDFPAYQAKITDVKDVASYSWVEGREASIVVPGIPPKWTSDKKTIWADLDEGRFFKDPNAARSPSYSLAPVVQAIFESDCEFQPSEIGLVACGSTMGNLLRFIQQDYIIRSPIVDRSFRFLVEVVGDTVFFIRREKSPTEIISHMHGYWHGFMKEQTSPIVDSAGTSVSHQRILGYQFAGMNMLAEADDKLEEDLATDTKDTVLKDGVIVTGKAYIPLSALFDLKTRTIKSQHRNILKEQLPRLWIRQVPYLIVAYHEPSSGCFYPDNTKISDVTEAVVEWEQHNEEDLRKLVSLINNIVSAAKQMSDQKLEVCYGKGGDVLELRSQIDGVLPVLPTGLAARWSTPADSPLKLREQDAGVKTVLPESFSA